MKVLYILLLAPSSFVLETLEQLQIDTIKSNTFFIQQESYKEQWEFCTLCGQS